MDGAEPNPFWSEGEQPADSDAKARKVKRRAHRQSLGASPSTEASDYAAAGATPEAKLAPCRLDAPGSGSPEAAGSPMESPQAHDWQPAQDTPSDVRAPATRLSIPSADQLEADKQRRRRRSRRDGARDEAEEESTKASGSGRSSRHERGSTCASFPVGSWARCVEATMLRTEETLKSEKVAEVGLGELCQILSHGERKHATWVRVRSAQGGFEGWMRCITSHDQPLLQPCPPPDAVALGDVVLGDVVLGDVARDLAGGTAQGAALGGRVDTATLPATRRTEVIDAFFERLDTANRGRLRAPELYRYAQICGFDGTADEWALEYEALCAVYGVPKAMGADRATFRTMVNDTERQNHWTDQELLELMESWTVAPRSTE